MIKPLSQCHVIVVDEDLQLICQVETALKLIGVEEVNGFTNDRSAIKILEKGNHHYDFAIFSQKMGGTTGTALIQRIRNSDSENRNIPIVMMIGSTNPKEIALVTEMGFVLTLVKPFINESLQEKALEIWALICHQANNSLNVTHALQYLIDMRYFDDAELLLKNLEKGSESQSPMLYINKGRIYLEKGQAARALKIANELLEKNESYLPALNLITKIYLKMKKYKEAYENMEKASHISPLNIKRNLELAKEHSKNDRHLRAEDLLKKSLAVDPANQVVLVDLIKCLQSQGKNRESQEYFAQLEDVNIVASHYNTEGVLAEKQGDHRKAIQKYYECYINLQSDHHKYQVLYNVALACYRSGDYKSATVLLDKSLQRVPRNFKKIELLRSRISTQSESSTPLEAPEIKKLINLENKDKAPEEEPENDALDSIVLDCLLED